MLPWRMMILAAIQCGVRGELIVHKAYIGGGRKKIRGKFDLEGAYGNGTKLRSFRMILF
jgi:hypothetical protein